MHLEKNRKQIIRTKQRTMRNQVSQRDRISACNNLIRNYLLCFGRIHNKNIAVYKPLDGEININPIIDLMKQNNNAIYIPEITSDHSMLFRDTNSNQIAVPDMFLVPLIAFDTQLNRLGFGGGYYDKFIHQYPGKIYVGTGYDFQCEKELPTESHDQPLDFVVTDMNIYSKHQILNT